MGCDDLDQIVWLDATGQAEMVRNGDVTARELVEHAISRIESLNPQVNAVITKTYDQALEAAERPLGSEPFAGVPFLIKDLGLDVKGVPQTKGSALLIGYRPRDDAELTRRYRQAGLIILGTTNTPPFGRAPVTESPLTGCTRNPWNLNHSSGGSSGGSAAAVAVGFVPMAHGSDGGGSIRIPASCCGLFGLKPTRGRVSRHPHPEAWGGLAIDHALTRSVRDSARLLDATAGPAPGDLYSAPPQIRPFATDVDTDPGHLHIGVAIKSPFATRVDPQCEVAVNNAAALCRSLSHTVEPISIEVDAPQYLGALTTLVDVETVAEIDRAAALTGRAPSQVLLGPTIWELYRSTRSRSAGEYVQSRDYLQSESRRITRQLAEYDAILTPTLGTPPPEVGEINLDHLSPEARLEKVVEFIPFTPIFNVTGQPAMSIPLGWSPQGLPIGVQFVGRFGDESTLFQLAGQLERAAAWEGRHPSLTRLRSKASKSA